MKKVLGMEILWIIFGGHHTIGPVYGVISMYFEVFIKLNVQKGDIFGGLQKFKIFFEVFDIPDIFGGKQ